MDPELRDGGLSLNLEGPVEQPAPLDITPADLAAVAEVEAELDTRWPETKIDPTLDRMELLMDLLGNPERSFPAIHVAGTNGKTSTVRMIESLMRAFSRRTGRTTSQPNGSRLTAGPSTPVTTCGSGAKSNPM